ncbi:C40 family peptidase [Nocardioides guangzhouensis]|nr:C40 family peptidase [Nocardioides guangzhouensis]
MRQGLLRTGLGTMVALLALVGCSLSPAPERADNGHDGAIAPAASRPTLSVGQPAWVTVSVATLWRSPSSPRQADAPALAHPARIGQWLAGMTVAQRRALSGRADTQALLGDRVRVVQLREGWARVVVPSQPSPLDARGYPGWVPRRQLTASRPAASATRATVVNRTAWLLTDQSTPSRLFRISFGTRLPVVGLPQGFVRVVTPEGTVRRLARSAVVVHEAGQPARPPSRSSLVSTAEVFLGLPYLWAGASGFGVDCSGLTWLVYRVHGITIPRDASAQARHGSAVSVLRRGDLRFYARDGRVHHVSMYVAPGTMIHAPGTGERVQEVPTSTLSREYVGARRYWP